MRYFNKVFNGESEGSNGKLEDIFYDENRRFVCRIKVFEVKVALNKMKLCKVMGLDNVPIEV